MPELYGKPFKYKLYQQIRQLENDLREAHSEHRETSGALEYANAKIVELEAKIQRMEQKARDVLTEATQELNIGERMFEIERKRREAWTLASFAAAELERASAA
jgi:hypothetical protein